jgi:hypothetical protein
MKKKFLLSVFLGLALIIFSGCASQNVATNQAAETTADQATDSSAKTSADATTASTAFTAPDRMPEITGIIKSITGNQIVVAELNLQNMGGQGGQTAQTGTNGDAAGTDKTTSKVDLTSAFSGTSASGGQGGPQGGGTPPSGGPGGGPDGSSSGTTGSGDTTTQDSMTKKLLAMSTSSKDVLVPVGIQMTKRGTPGQAGTEASLSDLKAGSMVTIWTDQTVADRNVAEFVSVN